MFVFLVVWSLFFGIFLKHFFFDNGYSSSNMLAIEMMSTTLKSTENINQDRIITATTIDNTDNLNSNSNSNSELISPACRPYYYHKQIQSNNISSRSSDSNNISDTSNNDNEMLVSSNNQYRPNPNVVPTRIYFRHMRKAGGTTVSKYLKRVIESQRTTYTELKLCEGWKGCLELNSNTDGYHAGYYPDEVNQTDKTQLSAGSKKGIQVKHKYIPNTPEHSWDPSGRTLYVTHIREPIARSIAHYKYDQRWHCKTQLKTKNFVPTVQNQRRSFDTFMYNAGGQLDSYRLWTCSTNCFSRWITGMYHPNDIYVTNNGKTYFDMSFYNQTYPYAQYYYNKNDDNDNDDSNSNNKNEQTRSVATSTTSSKSKSTTKTKTKFGQILQKEATKLFYRYDLIIVLEWLRDDPDYVEYITDIFFNGVPLHGNKPQPIFCDKESKAANVLVPLDLSSTTKQILQERNEIDIELYNILTTC